MAAFPYRVAVEAFQLQWTDLIKSSIFGDNYVTSAFPVAYATTAWRYTGRILGRIFSRIHTGLGKIDNDSESAFPKVNRNIYESTALGVQAMGVDFRQLIPVDTRRLDITLLRPTGKWQPLTHSQLQVAPNPPPTTSASSSDDSICQPTTQGLCLSRLRAKGIGLTQKCGVPGELLWE